MVRFAVDPYSTELTGVAVANLPSDWLPLACYAPGLPLSLALAGLVPIAISRRTKQRFVIALGWHAAPALPAASWPMEFGRDGIFGPAILLLGWWFATAAVFARLNTGVAVALTLLLPWHIGSVVLAAGDLWPGTGFGGLALTILVLGDLSAAADKPGTRSWWSASAASLRGHCLEPRTSLPRRAVLRRGPSRRRRPLTSASRDHALMEELPAHRGEVLIMGENVIDRREPGALERWCAYAERHDVLLYAGVLERNERSTIHEFSPERCAPAKQSMNGVSACRGSLEAGEWEPVRPGAFPGTTDQSTG